MNDFKFFVGLTNDPVSFFFGKQRVSFIFKAIDGLPLMMISNPAFERAVATGSGIEDLRANGGRIDRI